MKIGAMGLILSTAAFPGQSAPFEPRQLTFAAQGHVLTNINVWSPDSAWIVYDTRVDDGFNGTRIERINVASGEVQTLYTARHGAKCGVVTHSPVDGRLVFIHGPENPSADWTYSFTRRRGAVVDSDQPGEARPLDAMTYAPPFEPGALRGGSHVHVFSPDGEWVSFTYEDEVLAQLDASDEAPSHEPNQRNVGISVPAGPVHVPRSHERNHDGDWFSVVVTQTVAEPRPGSDEIIKAFEEGWVGHDGYQRADGKRQKRALAFQGLVTASNGEIHSEVFIVDLPDDPTRVGDKPLQGTSTTRPAPPRGVKQRRLTFTGDRIYPGVAAVPRHWLRVSPNGESIAFLMKDDAGIVQLWTVSPRGGPPRQITQNDHGVASAITWSPTGDRIAHVMNGSVCETDVTTGHTTRLTAGAAGNGEPMDQACVYSPDGKQIAYTQMVKGYQQIFVVETVF